MEEHTFPSPASSKGGSFLTFPKGPAHHPKQANSSLRSVVVRSGCVRVLPGNLVPVLAGRLPLSLCVPCAVILLLLFLPSIPNIPLPRLLSRGLSCSGGRVLLLSIGGVGADGLRAGGRGLRVVRSGLSLAVVGSARWGLGVRAALGVVLLRIRSRRVSLLILLSRHVGGLIGIAVCVVVLSRRIGRSLLCLLVSCVGV